jgi:hypothetical protein
MAALRRLLSALRLVALAAGCGSNTSPDPPVTLGGGAVTPPPPVPVPFLSGTVRNMVDAGPVSDVTVAVSGVGEAKSDAGGSFTVSGNGDGLLALTLRHPSFVERTTRARFPGASLSVSLIPATFDLAAFDEFLARASGLRRWTANPVLQVHRSVVDFAEFTGGGYAVTDRVMSGGELDSLVNGAQSSIEEMSGGRLTWVRLRRRASLQA